METYPTPHPSPRKPQPVSLVCKQEQDPDPTPAHNPTAKQDASFEPVQITCPSDLVVVRSLGSGAWGRVVMAQISNSTSLVAVKVFPKKEFSLTGEMSEHEINTEKRHLSHLPWSPFLAGAMTGISDSTNLSLVLELMPHGNFHDLIDRFGPLTPLTACFYFCNLVCAIGFIHGHGLVSRDIKPANFLVGPDGYLVMTDLGIAERVRAGGPWQDMGTIEYMAPELIQQGYTVGTAVDWWSSGVVLYEMLTQTMPFKGDSDQSVYHNILMLNYQWPEDQAWGNSLKHIISRLFTYDPEHRLGYSGTSQIMEHPWLSHVDWTWMRDRVYEAPWVPGGTEPIGKWHSQAMPTARSMGGMQVRYPPRHLRHDHRYRKRDFIVNDQNSGLELEDATVLDGSPEPALCTVTNNP